jgi:hypothetical protein
VTLKNAVFWDVTSCDSCNKRHFGGTLRLHYQGYVEVCLCSVHRLLVAANVVSSSPILLTLIPKAVSSFETLVLTRATRHNIPEDGILLSHRRENLKSYIALTG